MVGLERLIRDRFQDVGGSLIVPMDEGIDAIGRARLRVRERQGEHKRAGDEEDSLTHHRGPL